MSLLKFQLKLPESEIKERGVPVSFISNYDGVGYGYFIKDQDLNRVVYVSGGNGYYFAQTVKKVIVDGGEFYRDKLSEFRLENGNG